jgi:pimeloyl-ACP methyl ester carboxylesterase
VGGFGLIFWIPAAILVALIVSGIVYQRFGLAHDRRRNPPPGNVVDVDGRHLHVHVMGSGTPPVIFEAGIAATSLSWLLVQPEIAKTNQAISYDRAGLGWSDSDRGPRDLERLVEELRALLARAGIATPRIAAAYASTYPADVAGLVLVDPPSPSEWANPSTLSRAQRSRGILLANVGKVLAHLGVVRLTLNLLSSGARTAPQMIARASSGRAGSAFIDRMIGQIRKLPPQCWPAIQAHWSDAKCFRSIARQLEALPGCARAALSLAPIEAPMILLSAGDEHEDLLRCARRGRIQHVEGAGHWIQLDRPDAVIAAIQQINPSNPTSGA